MCKNIPNKYIALFIVFMNKYIYMNIYIYIYIYILCIYILYIYHVIYSHRLKLSRLNVVYIITSYARSVCTKIKVGDLKMICC